MTTFFTSDQHFGHKNIIEYSKRPFSSVYEMDETMVERHNAVVRDNDEVWHLGDFSFKSDGLQVHLPRLRGKHRLVAGNHDRCHSCHSRGERAKRDYIRAGFYAIDERVQVTLPGLGNVMLCHMPLRTANTLHDLRYLEHRPTEEETKDDNWLLHGHVHEKWKKKGKMINVGVDQWNFTPVSLEELVVFVEREG